MAFYISQISGEQIPYEPVTAATLRKEGLPEILRAETFAAEIETASPFAASPVADANPSTASAPVRLDVSSAAISHVAASVTGRAVQGEVSVNLESDALTYASDRLPVVPIRKERTATDGMPFQFREAEEAISAYQQAQEPSAHLARVVINVSEIMTAPVATLPEDSSVDAVWHFLREKRFRHVPIVSDAGKLIGIISDRDFLKVPNREELTALRDLLTTNIITARPDTDVRSAAKLMFDENIGALPVVDLEEQLVGILTRTDILRVLFRRAPLELWL